MYSVASAKNAIQLIYFALVVYEMIVFYINLAKYGVNEYTGEDLMIDVLWLLLSINLPLIIKFIFF